jgi:hypothetical protein
VSYATFVFWRRLRDANGDPGNRLDQQVWPAAADGLAGEWVAPLACFVAALVSPVASAFVVPWALAAAVPDVAALWDVAAERVLAAVDNSVAFAVEA